MALQITSLDDLTQSDYDTALSVVQEILEEYNPDAQIVGGALNNLLLRAAALLQAKNQVDMDRIRAANSLQAVEEDSTLTDDADEDVVDRLASNYNVTRLEAEAATGHVAIILDTQIVTVVPSGMVFTDAAGNTFTTENSFIARLTEDDVTTDTDRLLEAVGNGNYIFIVDVVADEEGLTGNIARNTSLTTDTDIDNFVKAFASEDFTGGRDTETNTDLITRLRSSWTTLTPATRAGLEGLIRSQEGFEDVIGVSTVGYGDSEQQRNHSLFPVALPGRVDSYVRTQGPWESVLVFKDALLVDTFSGGTRGVWQFTLTRDECPFYKIDNICLAEDAYDDSPPNYTVSLSTRGYDISEDDDNPGTAYLPDILFATEAAFSRYQTITIRFQDTDTTLGGLTIGVSTNSYAISYRSMPGIDELQDAVSERASRSLVGDVLIKAPVPCFVTATITLNHEVGTDDVDEDAVKSSVAAAVNATGFDGSLPASTLISAAQADLPTGSVVTAASMSGTIYEPDGTTTALSSSSALTPTESTTEYISARTICFFTSAAGLTLTINEVDSPEI